MVKKVKLRNTECIVPGVPNGPINGFFFGQEKEILLISQMMSNINTSEDDIAYNQLQSCLAIANINRLESTYADI